MIINVAVGLNVISTCAAPNSRTSDAEDAQRAEALAQLRAEHDEAGDQHRIQRRSRWRPSSAARRNSATIPPIATGREATLNDMIIWPSAMAIIGTQDSCASFAVHRCEIVLRCHGVLSRGFSDAIGLRSRRRRTLHGFSLRAARRRDPFPAAATGTWRRVVPSRCCRRRRAAARRCPARPCRARRSTMPPPIPLLPGSPMS